MPPFIPPTARNKAIQYLSMREHSYLELSRKLHQKGYESAEIDRALMKLIDDNLLSDARFGEAFVRSRVAKGQGPVRIRMELKEKGLSDFEIQQSFEANNEIDWDELIAATWAKKFSTPVEDSTEESTQGGAQDSAQRVKQWRFLQYRGFTSSQISHLFSRLASLSPS